MNATNTYSHNEAHNIEHTYQLIVVLIYHRACFIQGYNPYDVRFLNTYYEKYSKNWQM